MILDKDFSISIGAFPQCFFEQKIAVLSKCFSVFLFVGIFPIKTGMIFCLDAFAQRLL